MAGSDTAIYLAHLNPVTNAHIEIIEDLKKTSKEVHVMPVRFVSRNAEVNSRSFPFTFETRKNMLMAVFGNSIAVSPNYTFYSPFLKYMPPVLSPFSWRIKREILQNISNSYFTYTGDKAEAFVLKLYKMNPVLGKRKEISASSVKEKMFLAAKGEKTDWEKYVPDQAVQIIKENWDVVKQYADDKDRTYRILGMKFPRQGFW